MNLARSFYRWFPDVMHGALVRPGGALQTELTAGTHIQRAHRPELVDYGRSGSADTALGVGGGSLGSRYGCRAGFVGTPDRLQHVGGGLVGGDC